MGVYGGLSSPAAMLITLLLVGYLAIYPGLFAVLVGMAVRRFGASGVWVAPGAWVATEWARATVAGGFPWALLGTSQATVLPVAQFASVAGVYGLSALVALVSTAAAAITLTRRRQARFAAAAVIAMLVLTGVGGALRMTRSRLTQTGAVLRVGLLQGNIDQAIKWDPAFRASILDRYLDLSRQVIGAGAGLVVWPEASTPFFFDLDDVQAGPVRQLAAQSRTPFLIGTDDYEAGTDPEPDRIFNAAVLVGADGLTQARYRKMHLVPFGEYVPFKPLLFFVDSIVEAVSDFTPGDEPVVFDLDGRRVSVSICYESVYPGLSRRFVAGGSQLLVTITNDAWFGRSSAATQHFQQGALRAIEQGRYVVRAANTGISGAVDPYGRVLLTTPLFETAAVTADVRLLDQRTIYGYIGDVVVWASLGLCGWLLVASRRPRVRIPRSGPATD
jgi:apolipoprotein N-acyltransferase